MVGSSKVWRRGSQYGWTQQNIKPSTEGIVSWLKELSPKKLTVITNLKFQCVITMWSLSDPVCLADIQILFSNSKRDLLTRQLRKTWR